MKLDNLKKPFIIAEIGINHEGNFKTAKKLIFNAKMCGADAVKFQVFNPNTLASKKSKKSSFQKKSIGEESLEKMWKRLSLSFKEFEILRKYAKKIKIKFICTAFDFESLNIVKKLKVDAIKIASSDITDVPLIEKLSKIKKPIILSTGMSKTFEIKKILKILRKNKVAILHCISLYPCNFKEAHLNRIIALKNKFKKYTIGYSDHCMNTSASLQAMSLGADIIEKHFTLNKKKKGLDHSLSADSRDLQTICEFSKNLSISLGSKSILPSSYERKFTKLFRKGIYFTKNIDKGTLIKADHIIIRRPENSAKPEKYKSILGKKTLKSFFKDESVNLKFIY